MSSVFVERSIVDEAPMLHRTQEPNSRASANA